MFIPDPDPDFYPSRIPDLGSRISDPRSRIPDPGSKKRTKERGEKIYYQTFLCSHKFHKNVNYFIFEVLKKKNWANFQRIIELFIQKIVTKLSKILEIRDPGSGKKTIPDPESRGQKGTGSRIRMRNTASD
jgi:hypothetical protein